MDDLDAELSLLADRRQLKGGNTGSPGKKWRTATFFRVFLKGFFLAFPEQIDRQLATNPNSNVKIEMN